MPITKHSKCPQYEHPITVTEDDNGDFQASGGVVEIPVREDPNNPDTENPNPKAIKGLCPSCRDEINRVLAGWP